MQLFPTLLGPGTRSSLRRGRRERPKAAKMGGATSKGAGGGEWAADERLQGRGMRRGDVRQAAPRVQRQALNRGDSLGRGPHAAAMTLPPVPGAMPSTPEAGSATHEPEAPAGRAPANTRRGVRRAPRVDDELDAVPWTRKGAAGHKSDKTHVSNAGAPARMIGRTEGQGAWHARDQTSALPRAAALQAPRRPQARARLDQQERQKKAEEEAARKRLQEQEDMSIEEQMAQQYRAFAKAHQSEDTPTAAASELREFTASVLAVKCLSRGCAQFTLVLHTILHSRQLRLVILTRSALLTTQIRS